VMIARMRGKCWEIKQEKKRKVLQNCLTMQYTLKKEKDYRRSEQWVRLRQDVQDLFSRTCRHPCRPFHPYLQQAWQVPSPQGPQR
jgi:hypothetical protein